MARKHHGLHRYRFKDNPEEKRFADAWQAQNDLGKTLGYMLGDGNRPVEPTDREVEVAATVMQWLGSHVGECFLRDLGYVKEKAK